MFREDYLIRLIRQFAEALRKLAGLRERGEHAAALRASAELYDELTSVPRAMSDTLDTPTFAALLGGAEKQRTMALLLWEEGRIYTSSGDPLTAAGRYRRAHELFLEARALEPGNPDDDSAILELSRVAPARELSARYRAG